MDGNIINARLPWWSCDLRTFDSSVVRQSLKLEVSNEYPSVRITSKPELIIDLALPKDILLLLFTTSTNACYFMSAQRKSDKN